MLLLNIKRLKNVNRKLSLRDAKKKQKVNQKNDLTVLLLQKICEAVKEKQKALI